MTAQVPDTVTIDGEEWFLLETPADPLLARIEAPPFESHTTANWRGYVADWRVEADVLSLVGIGFLVRDRRHFPDWSGGVLGELELPLVADWVTGTLRVARGDVVRYVHMGFASRWTEEVLLEVEAGRVLGRTRLDEPGPMGSAGPYRLVEPLLAGVAGGAFGQVVLAADLDGADLVAKLPRPCGGGLSATEIFRHDPDGNRWPVHVPAVALRERPGFVPGIEEAGAPELEAVLEREAEILERDGGRLLPRYLGTWAHDPQGTPVVVMERLVGRRPERLADIETLLLALAAAVGRGTFDAHGDVKLEHVFIEDDGAVRLCDPAPRFDDPTRRGYTPTYNPRGHTGPAADVAACATMLRYLVEDAPETWRWCSAVLDDETAPAWADSHLTAYSALRTAVEEAVPPPPDWTVPPLPGRSEGLGMAAPATQPRPAGRDAGPDPFPPIPPIPSVELGVPLLPGWTRGAARFAFESADGVARIEVDDERAPGLRTEDLVERTQPAVYGLPGFEQLAEPAPYTMASGVTAWYQRFRFDDDGRRVERLSVYLCRDGRARTASGTAAADLWQRHVRAVSEALERLVVAPSG